MRHGTKKERRWLYVDFEKVYRNLIRIFAEQEQIEGETTIMKVGVTNEKEEVN